jgi:hypothetical protein
MNETDLLHMLIERVPFDLPDVRVFRRNIINRVVEERGRKFTLKNGIKGQADAYALVRGGLHVELETKAARGAMRDEQWAWRSFCHRFGIPHLVLRARPDEHPSATVERWIEELTHAAVKP